MIISKYLKNKVESKSIKRNELINLICEYAGDELETINDWIKLAKMTKKDLKLDILNLAEYYKRNE